MVTTKSSRIIRGYQKISENYSNVILTIGNFDGLHLGHQNIVEAVVQESKRLKGTSVVYTFRPHPKAVLSPEKKLRLLTTYDEKLELLTSKNVDVIIEEPFGRDFSTLSAKEFFEDVLIQKLSVQKILVGHDFGFGRDRAGSLEALKEFCAKNQVELTIFSPLLVDGITCSSSQIRSLLENGEVKKAARFLGRDYAIRGVVVHGDKRGGKIGFPTTNIDLQRSGSDGKSVDKIAPKNGVYITKTAFKEKDGVLRQINGVTNVGVRPTFKNTETTSGGSPSVLIETHLLNFNESIYGKKVQVSFLERIRDEKKFSGVEELVIQIKNDVLRAEEFFSQ